MPGNHSSASSTSSATPAASAAHSFSADQHHLQPLPLAAAMLQPLMISDRNHVLTSLQTSYDVNQQLQLLMNVNVDDVGGAAYHQQQQTILCSSSDNNFMFSDSIMDNDHVVDVYRHDQPPYSDNVDVDMISCRRSPLYLDHNQTPFDKDACSWASFINSGSTVDVQARLDNDAASIIDIINDAGVNDELPPTADDNCSPQPVSDDYILLAQKMKKSADLQPAPLMNVEDVDDDHDEVLLELKDMKTINSSEDDLTTVAIPPAVAAGYKWATSVLSNRRRRTEDVSGINYDIVAGHGTNHVSGSSSRSSSCKQPPQLQGNSDAQSNLRQQCNFVINHNFGGGRAHNSTKKTAAAAADSNGPQLQFHPTMSNHSFRGGGDRVFDYSRSAAASATADSNRRQQCDGIITSNTYESLNGTKPPIAHTSKNIASERRRRKRLNEKLYSLRSLVPIISKMDKASIVRDAISYVRDLQRQVEEMEAEVRNLRNCTKIHSLEANNKIDDGIEIKVPVVEVDELDEQRRQLCLSDVIMLNSDASKTAGGSDNASTTTAGGAEVEINVEPSRHQILALDVIHMEDRVYDLRILLKKSCGVLVRLTQALESLNFEILNANISVVNDHIINNLIIEVKNGNLLKCEEIQQMALNVIPNYGFYM